MAITGTFPSFPSPGLAQPRPFPALGAPPQPLPGFPPPAQSFNRPAPGFSVMGPASNGMVPVMRSQLPASNGGAVNPPLPSLNAPLPSGWVGDSFSPSGAAATPPASIPGQPGSLSNALSPTGQPLSATEMGQKIGSVAGKFLEENPAVFEKLKTVDLEELEKDIGPKVEGVRAQLQQALKKIPQGVDNRLIRMLDDRSQQVAKDVDEWLRKEPDPTVMAELARKERLKAQEEALGGKTGPAKAKPTAGSDPLADLYADDPLAAEDPFADTLPAKKSKETWKDKALSAKDKVMDKAQSSWPLNRNKPASSDLAGLEEELAGPPRRPPSRPRPAADPLGAAGGREGEMTDADLDNLLGGGGLNFKSKANPSAH